MTKIIKYFGNNNPTTITHESEINARDFRPMYKCDSDICIINNKPLPSGKVVSFGGDLHACKLYKECRDNVAGIWEHKRKTFNPQSYLLERVSYHTEKGVDKDMAEEYARIDLQKKKQELKLKPIKKKRKEFANEHHEKLKLRAIKTSEYIKQGITRKEAWHKAHNEVFNN